MFPKALISGTVPCLCQGFLKWINWVHRFRDNGWGTGPIPRAAQFLVYFTNWVFTKDFLWSNCVHLEIVENAYLSLGWSDVSSKLTFSVWKELVNMIILLSKSSDQIFESWQNKLWLVVKLHFLLFPTFKGPLSLEFSPDSHQKFLSALTSKTQTTKIFQAKQS